MFISNNTIFLKKKFLEKETNASKIKLSKVYEIEEPVHTESDLIGESNSKPMEAPLRRFDRVPHQPNKYYDFLV